MYLLKPADFALSKEVRNRSASRATSFGPVAHYLHPIRQ